MKTILGVVFCASLLLTSCGNSTNETKVSPKKEDSANSNFAVEQEMSCIEPYLYFDDFNKSTIQLECFNLNELSIADKDRFVYGYHYFCDQKNAETGGSFEVFADGIVKINNKIEILEPLMILGTDKYYINESYIIRAFNGSQTYEKGNPKIEITVFDLKKKTQSTSAFYFSWFCEA